MSKLFFPFNSIVTAGVADRAANAETLAAYLKGLFKNGVLYSSTSLKATAGSGMVVNVQPGTAYINGKIFANDEAERITLETASATLSRIDRIVLRLDEINRLIEVAAVKGTAASNPAAPALTRTDDIYELCLAEVRVPAGATSIQASYITDTRSTGSICGWVSNLVRSDDTYIYKCNGINDNVTLVSFINECLQQQDRAYIKVTGAFVANATRYTQEGTSYHFAYVGNNNLTLDFSDADRIEPGISMYVKNCTLKGADICGCSGAATTSKHVIKAVDATLENCRITGDIEASPGIAYYAVRSRLISCTCDVSNSVGTCTGVYGEFAYMTDCDIKATASTASAYAAEMLSSRAQGCTFTGISTSSATTSSGNGAIISGQYSGCTFIGIGALKGQGCFLRAGYYLQAVGCIFRGYTADAVNGWGIGLTGANDSGITLALFGINCNQVPVTGYNQTASCTFASGYGSIAGVFYQAMTVPETIVGYGVINRNRN